MTAAPRCPTNKQGHATKHAARAALVAVRARRARTRGRTHGVEAAAYACPLCDQWHLTSHDGRKPRRR